MALRKLRRSTRMAMVRGDPPAEQHLQSESVAASHWQQKPAAAKMSLVPEAIPVLFVPADEEDRSAQPAVSRQPQTNVERKRNEELMIERTTLAADAQQSQLKLKYPPL